MGAILTIIKENNQESFLINVQKFINRISLMNKRQHQQCNGLSDISKWPPELSLAVLSYLNATDLCLASCVWQELATDQILWHSLCRSNWGYVSIYKRSKSNKFSYHRLYLLLDEGSITFNADPFLGMEYFFNHDLLENKPEEVAQFLSQSKCLKKNQICTYLNENQEIMDSMIRLQNFHDIFLPKALRAFFKVMGIPNFQNFYFHRWLEKFSQRFCDCNPNLDLNPEMVYILCFSLIFLSVDLNSPVIKNKMSKREFIRNVRKAVNKMDDELYGCLYDDIYLKGHITACVDEY